MKRTVKGQAAMDLLLTYSWVIVVVVGILGALTISGVFDLGFLQKNECEASHPIICEYLTVTENVTINEISIDTVLQNLGASKINVNNLVFTDSNGNTCKPQNSLDVNISVGKQAQVIFNCANTLESGTLSISYTNTESKAQIQQLSKGDYKINEILEEGEPLEETTTTTSKGDTISFKVADNSESISSTNPIIITTPEELSNIRHTLTDNSITHFQLANNIDLTGFDTDTNTANGNWEPIGNVSNSFRGKSFDGNGFSITGLNINVSSQHDVGLFGYVQNGANISNVSASGSVSGNENVGGLIGEVRNSNVSHVSFSGNVSGSHNSGGLIGIFISSNLSSSFASGNFTFTGNYVGGLVGSLSSSSNLSSSFASGDVTSTGNYVGGLVGGFRSGGSISSSFAYGSVTGNAYIRGLVGYLQSGVCVSSYWDTQTSGQTNSGCTGATGKTTSELQTPTSNTGIYATWDPNIWDFGTSSEYPSLKIFSS